MEIQVKSTIQRTPSKRLRPLPNPLLLLASGELSLYHAHCGGHITVDSDDPKDFEAYTTVRCNLCFDTNREKQAAIARALAEVLVENRRSDACTVLTFTPLSSRELLAPGPLASRLQRYFGLNGRTRR